MIRLMRYGAVATIPMIVGGIPFGLLFGSLASSYGLSPWLVGSLVAFVVGIWRQQQLLTIIVGVATFFLAKFCIS